MSTSAERGAGQPVRGRPGRGPADGSRLAVDRVACTGHGVCAQLLAGVALDEWGYPVVDEDRVARENGRDAVATAVRLCPARALFLR